MSIDQILILKAFIKLSLIGILLVFAIYYCSQIKSIKNYKSIILSLVVFTAIFIFSSWMIGVGFFTYPNHHFKNLCESAGRKDFRPMPSVQSMLLERNTGIYPHRDGFSPWGFVAGSKIIFLEQKLAGKSEGEYGIYKESSSIQTENTDSSVSDIALEIKTISSNAEINAELYGEEMSFYNIKTKEIYSKFTYYWNSRNSLVVCPKKYYEKYSGINTTKWAIEIVGAKNE